MLGQASPSEIVDVTKVVQQLLIFETEKPPDDEHTREWGTSKAGMMLNLRVWKHVGLQEASESARQRLIAVMRFQYTEDCKKSLLDKFTAVRKADPTLSCLVQEGVCPEEDGSKAFAFRVLTMVADGNGATVTVQGPLVFSTCYEKRTKAWWQFWK
jgi:hypothetical protein